LFEQGVVFESLNHGQFNPIQEPWVKDNAMFDHGPLTMDGGYCTLFLIKIDLWSRGALPIDRSPWSMDGGGSSWVGGVV